MKQEELQQIPAVIHVHTKVSGGAYTASEIAELARRNGISAVLFSDKAERTFVYGAAPFRGILRVTLHRESAPVSEIGGYLKSVDAAQSANRDVVLIPGLEVAPYYVWEGDPRAGSLTVRETDCELLVYGLKKESDWKNMPYISNPSAEYFTAGSIARLVLCVVLFAAGAAMVIKKKKQFFDVGLSKRQRISRETHPMRPAGIFVLFLAVVLAAVYFPFKSPPFSQYEAPADRGAPYQLFADYISRHGGISLWAHPDVKVRTRMTNKLPVNGFLSAFPLARREFSVTAVCEGCSELVRKVGGVTGFANLDLGGGRDHSEICGWDSSLARYAKDGGPKPLWAEAERDFYGVSDEAGTFADTQTVFLIKGTPTREKLLDALREGKMYAVRGHGGTVFRLRGFKVSDGARDAVSGDTLKTKGNVRVSGVIDSTGKAGMKFRARLIGGGTIREFSGKTPYTFDFKYEMRESGYFRIEADDYANAMLISNPIFVKKGT